MAAEELILGVPSAPGPLLVSFVPGSPEAGTSLSKRQREFWGADFSSLCLCRVYAVGGVSCRSLTDPPTLSVN